MQNRNETVLVTGAAGFIGYSFSLRLLQEGYTVAGYDEINDYYDPGLKQARIGRLQKSENFSFTKGDLADKAALEALFEQVKPDYVVNLAAQAGVRYSIDHPDCYIRSNIVGFFNILEAVRNHKVKHLLYASSSSVYGNREKTPFSTDDPVDHPVSLYAATKKSNELLADCYSHLYGIRATGLRFFTVYGPWGRPDMAYFSFTKKILSGEPIRVFNNGDLYRDFTYVDDIVEGMYRLLTAPPEYDDKNDTFHTVYNIGNNRPVKLLRFIEIIEETVGKKANIEMLPMQPGDVYMTCADVEPLMRTVGFAPSTSLETGIARFYDWYRSYYPAEK